MFWEAGAVKPADRHGHLDRARDGTLVWHLVDSWGSRTEGVATRDPAGGWVLTGRLVRVGEGVALPGDGEWVALGEGEVDTPAATP